MVSAELWKPQYSHRQNGDVPLYLVFKSLEQQELPQHCLRCGLLLPEVGVGEEKGGGPRYPPGGRWAAPKQRDWCLHLQSTSYISKHCLVQHLI